MPDDSGLSAYLSISEFLHNDFVQAALTIACTLIAQLVLRNLINRVVTKTISRQRHNDRKEEAQRVRTLSSMLQTVVSVTLWIVAVIVILSQFGANLAALMTGAGLFSVIIGFGAQSIIKDFLGGLFIILENQYRIDDIVTLQTSSGQSVTGAVESISLRVTKLRDLDGNVHWVSNGASTVVSNASSSFANVNIDIRVGYTSDMTKVEQVSNEVGTKLAADKAWKDRIIEPVQFLWVKSFDEYAVSVKFLGKVKPGTQYDVASEFRRRLLVAFKQHGIEVPLAQVVIQDEA